jgi:DNA repair exonuclease SbcCD ATPase subunit
MIDLEQLILMNSFPFFTLLGGIGLGILGTLFISSIKNKDKTTVLERLKGYVDREVDKEIAKKIDELSGFIIEMNTATMQEIEGKVEEKIKKITRQMEMQEGVVRSLVEANNGVVQELRTQKEMILSRRDELIDDVNALKSVYNVYSTKLNEIDDRNNEITQILQQTEEVLAQRDSILAGYERMIEEHKEIIETNFRLVSQYQMQVEEAKQRKYNQVQQSQNGSPVYSYPPSIPGNGNGLSNVIIPSTNGNHSM